MYARGYLGFAAAHGGKPMAFRLTLHRNDRLRLSLKRTKGLVLSGEPKAHRRVLRQSRIDVTQEA